MADIEKDFVHLARLALDGKTRDVAALVRRSLSTILDRRPDLQVIGKELLAKAISAGPVREAKAAPIPVDLDSRLELLRWEHPVVLPTEPIWPDAVKELLQSIVQERQREEELDQHGLAPTRTAVFIGEPGVGKTLAAKWIARELNRPLLTLDLAAVMSSFLGRTGNNIRSVLEYARQGPYVLLLDEFDAIAKRRDDVSEVGELKRLVTVLLQAVDDWPVQGLLLAATNHSELLDPAIWRRFERLIRFPMPRPKEIKKLIQESLSKTSKDRLELLTGLLNGYSFSDIHTFMKNAKRDSIVQSGETDQAFEFLVSLLSLDASEKDRIKMALLLEKDLSQRLVAKLTHVSRDTIRKHAKGEKE